MNCNTKDCHNHYYIVLLKMLQVHTLIEPIISLYKEINMQVHVSAIPFNWRNM